MNEPSKTYLIFPKILKGEEAEIKAYEGYLLKFKEDLVNKFFPKFNKIRAEKFDGIIPMKGEVLTETEW